MKGAAPEPPTLAQFAAALQSTCRVRIDTGMVVELVLIEATAGRGRTASEDRESFSVIFQGPGDRLLPQRTYSLEHDILGRFDLFIVPVGQDQSGFQYQAIFNRRSGAS
jgi:hypothetical protein